MGVQRIRRAAWVVEAIVIAIVVTAAPALAKPGKGSQRACIQPPSWVAGTTNLCRGTIVYNDYDSQYRGFGETLAAARRSPSTVARHPAWEGEPYVPKPTAAVPSR